MNLQGATVQLSDLVESGLLPVPSEIYFDFMGLRSEATVEDGVTIRAYGRTFASLSVAAGWIITARTRRTSPDRNYFACNGWRMWRVRTAGGDDVLLRDLRERLAATWSTEDLSASVASASGR